MKKNTQFCLAAVALLVATATQADTVAIPVGQQTMQSTISVPRSGMSKTSVERQYGAPVNRQAAVGYPPISSWSYNGFTVYFEYDRVIHTVVEHRPQQN